MSPSKKRCPSPFPPKHDVERAGPAVARMRATHGSNVAGMPRGGQPVAYGSPDCAAADGPAITFGPLTGDEQKHPRAHGDRLV